jgi:hypothetical protein
MREMDRRVGILRLLLADIADRERQADEARKQLHGQLRRIVDFTVQYNGGVPNALVGMAEVEDRLRQQEASLRHLALLRARARGELHALIVTRDIAEAQRRLAELEAQRARLLSPSARDGAPTPVPPAGDAPPHDATPNLAEIDAEITSLRAAIEAASADAARSLANGDADQRGG